MTRYPLARAIRIKSMTELELKTLQKEEVSKGLIMATELSPDNHKNVPLNYLKQFTAKINENDGKAIREEIDRVIPCYKDPTTQDYYTEQEFIHVWDWQIFHKCPRFAETVASKSLYEQVR